VHEALRNPQLSAKANGGHPAIAATARPAAFSGPGVVGAKGAPPLKPVTPPANAQTRPTEPAHPQTAAARPPMANANVPHAPPAAAAHPGAPPPKAAPKTAAKPAPKPKPEEKNEK
jgi:hypothetical protein